MIRPGRVALANAAILLALASCSDASSLDDRATALRERLGDLCDSFDFQTKTEVNGSEYRPVDCKTDDGVILRILVFEDAEHLQKSWRDVPESDDAVASGDAGPMGLGVEDEAATVVVYDRSLIDDVRSRLSE